MYVLAIDTIGHETAVALVARDRPVQALACAGGGASRQVLSLIDRLLLATAIRREDISRIAVAAGPGSFTGLRVGIATASGLGRALGRSVLGVSSLAAIACVAAQEGESLTVLTDAFRGQVYGARFRRGALGLERLTADRVWLPTDAARELLRADERAIGSGVERYQELLAAAVPEARLGPGPGGAAAGVAELALATIGDATTTLEPLYLRESGSEAHVRG